MSRYLFRRRVKIVVAVAALIFAVPLIGWASYRLALKVARDSRPPARVRYLTGAAAATPQIVVEHAADDAKLYIEARYDDGPGQFITGRFSYFRGGPGVGDWNYRHAGTFTLDGTLTREAAPAGEWLALAPGQSATLAAFREADGTALTLRAWCLPEELTDSSTVIAADGTVLVDGAAAVQAWVAAHPPDDEPR